MIDDQDMVFLCDVVKKAGQAILPIYARDFAVQHKEDKSPLTEADLLSNQILEKNIRNRFEYPILSEEGKSISTKERQSWTTFWCIDPLDGTKEFVKKNGEFTVNVALIHEGQSVVGVIYAPVLDLLYFAKKDSGAFVSEKNQPEQKLQVDDLKNPSLKVVTSRSHKDEKTQKFVQALSDQDYQIEEVSVGSSLKICYLANDRAQIYPRFAPTMEWDIAAGQCILEEAGGILIDLKSQQPLRYNKDSLRNPNFLACSTRELYQSIQSLATI